MARIDGTGSVLVQLRFFVISYFPLFTIFAIQSFPELIATIIMGVLAGIAILDCVNLLHRGSKIIPRTIHVERVDDGGPAIVAYLATYILPFVAVEPFSSWRSGLSIAVYFLVLFVVFAQSDLGLVNPTLYLFGRRIVEVTTEESSLRVITRTPVVVGDDLRVMQFQGVWMNQK